MLPGFSVACRHDLELGGPRRYPPSEIVRPVRLLNRSKRGLRGDWRPADPTTRFLAESLPIDEGPLPGCPLPKLAGNSPFPATTFGPFGPLCRGRGTAASRHWFASRLPWRRRQVRHRRLVAEAPKSPPDRPGRREVWNWEPDGSAGAPNPGTSQRNARRFRRPSRTRRARGDRTERPKGDRRAQGVYANGWGSRYRPDTRRSAPARRAKEVRTGTN